MLGGDLGLRQRAEVKVLGAGQVSPSAQRHPLAIHHKGLATLAEGLLHLLDLWHIQRIIGTVARDDHRGYRHAQRVQGGQGDLDLRQVVAILAVAELDVTQVVLNLDIGVGGAGIDAKEVGLEIVYADDVLVEVHLEVLPDQVLVVFVQGEAVEDVGQAVILEVQGADGFAQSGLESVPVGLRPGLKAVEAVVALGNDVADPHAGDLAEGQLALPEVPGRVVAVEVLGHFQQMQRGQQHRDVVHSFDSMHLRVFGVHPLILSPFPLCRKPLES